MDKILKDIQKMLLDIGIQKGDIVYIASDITLLMRQLSKKGIVVTKCDRNIFLDKLTDLFQDSVGKDGTLLFPVFSWDFCRGKAFNIKTSLGEVGAYNNWLLQRRLDFSRTQHPIYSFLVWGKNAQNLVTMENISAWGNDSPFAYLHQNKAKFILFNVSLQRGFTFMHYVEESIKVPYRYYKAFKCHYINEIGVAENRTYSMYVRDLMIVSEEYLPDTFLDIPNVMKKTTTESLRLKCIDLKKAYDIVKDDLLHNGGRYCYKFKNYEIDWSKGATHDDEIGD